MEWFKETELTPGVLKVKKGDREYNYLRILLPFYLIPQEFRGAKRFRVTLKRGEGKLVLQLEPIEK